MKKYGKYEKRPEGVPAKQPRVKNMLLQTYFTSLLCLVLCVTMFFGTSYAWFTSEVNNSANEIYVGTLAVGLYKGDDDLDGSSEKLFDGNIRWEPGYTALETITVKNEGDLAFKYVLYFTDGSLAGESEKTLVEVASCFDVWVYDHYQKEYSAPASYADINREKGWDNVGTLDMLLNGKTVLDGNMVTVWDSNDGTAANAGTTDGVATADTYTIALHMKEDTDAAVMGEKISLNVKLVAYQKGFVNDGFVDGNYDSNVTVAFDAASLKTALNTAGSNAQLISDVTVKNADDCLTVNGGTLYGNGKTITYSGNKVDGYSAGVLATSGGSINNLNIVGGDNGRALYITELTSDLTVSNCVLSGAYSFNLNSSTKAEDHTLTFENTTFKSWTSYDNVIGHAYFTNCTFNANFKPYGDTTLTNCTFTMQGGGLDVSNLENGETVQLVNCTYNGEVINATVTANDGSISIEGSDLIEIKTTMNDANEVTDRRVVLKPSAE